MPSSKSQVTSILKKTVATEEGIHAVKKFVKFAIPVNSSITYDASNVDSSMEVDIASKSVSTVKTSQDTTTSGKTIVSTTGLWAWQLKYSYLHPLIRWVDVIE